MTKNNSENILNHKDKLIDHCRHKGRFLLKHIQTDGQENNDEQYGVKVREDNHQDTAFSCQNQKWKPG